MLRRASINLNSLLDYEIMEQYLEPDLRWKVGTRHDGAVLQPLLPPFQPCSHLSLRLWEVGRVWALRSLLKGDLIPLGTLLRPPSPGPSSRGPHRHISAALQQSTNYTANAYPAQARLSRTAACSSVRSRSRLCLSISASTSRPDRTARCQWRSTSTSTSLCTPSA